MEVVEQGGAGQDVQEGDGEGEEWTEGGMEDEGFLSREIRKQPSGMVPKSSPRPRSPVSQSGWRRRVRAYWAVGMR